MDRQTGKIQGRTGVPSVLCLVPGGDDVTQGLWRCPWVNGCPTWVGTHSRRGWVSRWQDATRRPQGQGPQGLAPGGRDATGDDSRSAGMCLLGSLHAPGWPQNSHCHCPLTGTVLSPCLVPQLSPRSALAPSSSWHRHCPHPWHRHCLVARDHRHSPQLDTVIVPHVTSQLPPSWPWHRPHPWHHHCPHWWHCHCPQLGITVLHLVPSLSPVWHRHCPLSWHRHCPPPLAL